MNNLNSIRTIAFLCLIMCGSSLNAWGQDQPEYRWFEATHPGRTTETSVRKMMSGSAPLDQKLLASWWTYRFKTLTIEENLTKLTDLRRDMRKRMKPIKVEAVREAINKLSVSLLPRIYGQQSGTNFHPAVRVNMMLLMGELNSREATGFGKEKSPEIPYKPAANALAEALRDPKQIDAVRVAAMVGFVRHLKLQHKRNGYLVPAPDQFTVRKAMVELLTASKPPAERTIAGHQWMQGRAIEILGLMNSEENNKLLDVFVALVGDDNVLMSTRVQAAAMLGKLRLTKSTPVKGDVAVNLATLARDACDAEVEPLTEYEKYRALNYPETDVNIGDNLLIDGGEDLGEGEGEIAVEVEADPYLVVTRARLKSRLMGVKSAFGDDAKGGVTALLSDPAQKNSASRLIAVIEAIDKKLDDKQIDLDTLLAELEESSSTLSKHAKKRAVALKPATPVNTETGGTDEPTRDAPTRGTPTRDTPTRDTPTRGPSR